MYGTVARTRVKPENRQALQEVFAEESGEAIEGYVSSYVLFENDGDTMWLFAVFADRQTYDRNANDPRQHERYTRYRALMEDEPEWHDGVIETM